MELLNKFMDSKKPVPGLCPGQQIINVAPGGTLYQDTAAQKPAARVRQDPFIYDESYHLIELTPQRGIAALYSGGTCAKVNTLHHQAIDRLSADLETEAYSVDDGLIEAVRFKGPQYLVGVQWHPEFLHGWNDGVLDSGPLLQEFPDATRLKCSR